MVSSTLCRFLLGFVFPVMWYYATVFYFGNYYRKDPREMAGLATSAIAVNTYEAKKQELMAENEQLRALLHSMQTSNFEQTRGERMVERPDPREYIEGEHVILRSGPNPSKSSEFLG
ncbi:hypothetical protein GIB67_039711 [Kingdonia uniflora]|uniref:Uncharacterized protein n=1 Tax=Kingdonia uniflora TaxID=39325 RepID=A0A7J7MQ76_9MAGN|nr:hypothetical protein GIB67_039711 [Kingdonia uniflora]